MASLDRMRIVPTRAVRDATRPLEDAVEQLRKVPPMGGGKLWTRGATECPPN